jgi:hypothetical protein
LYCRDKMLNETQADFAISFGWCAHLLANNH